VSNAGIYPTNYLSRASDSQGRRVATSSGSGYDQTGAPSLFANTNAVQSFQGQFPGTVGTAGILRGAKSINTDVSISKYFKLPIEGHRLEARAEAFNVFNNVNFSSPALELGDAEHVRSVFRSSGRACHAVCAALRILTANTGGRGSVMLDPSRDQEVGVLFAASQNFISSAEGRTCPGSRRRSIAGKRPAERGGESYGS
jgi:hypothetical protein